MFPLVITPAERLRATLRDRYRLELDLGQGVMAAIFQARDVCHDRTIDGCGDE